MSILLSGDRVPATSAGFVTSPDRPYALFDFGKKKKKKHAGGGSDNNANNPGHNSNKNNAPAVKKQSVDNPDMADVSPLISF